MYSPPYPPVTLPRGTASVLHVIPGPPWILIFPLWEGNFSKMTPGWPLLGPTRPHLGPFWVILAPTWHFKEHFCTQVSQKWTQEPPEDPSGPSFSHFGRIFF